MAQTSNTNSSSSTSAAKKKNPLYVVNKKKKFVEPATSILDYWVKRWGLNDVVQMIQTYVKEILKQLNSASFIHAFLELLQKKMNELIKVLNQLNRFSLKKNS